MVGLFVVVVVARSPDRGTALLACDSRRLDEDSIVTVTRWNGDTIG